MFSAHTKKQRRILTALTVSILSVLTVGIFLTVRTAQERQIQESNAASATGIAFFNQQYQPITQTTSPTVNVELTAPWPIQTAAAHLGMLSNRRQRMSEAVGGAATTIVYDEQLRNGWTDGSYRATINYKASDFAYNSTKSIKVNAQGGGALEFNAPRGFSTVGYTHVQFAIHASKPNTDLAIYAEDGNFKTLGNSKRLVNYSGYPSATGWTVYTVPLADLRATNRVIGDISIQNNTNRALPTFYVDKVQLIGAGQTQPPVIITSAPTTKPATQTPTPNATATSTPKPTATPVPLYTTSVVIAEDAAFTKNVKTISPYSMNPFLVSYTFSSAAVGTKTLYAKFTASNGTTQMYSNSIQLVANVTPTPTGTSTPTPTPTRAPTPVVSGGNYGTPIAGLHVQGAKVVNSANQQVRMVGVNFSGAEYTCIGNGGHWDVPADQATINAMKTWHIRVARITLNEDCWLGINGITAAFATSHRQAVVSFTNLLIQNNIVPLINLHFSGDGAHAVKEQEPMAGRAHSLAFWTSVANTFKGNSSVMLEPYNEPHLNDVSITGSSNHWQCWRDGGCTVKGSNSGEGSFVVAGMQEMVNAIRGTGATNIIVITGENWGSDVSGWLQYKPNDPLNQLAVGWHTYGDGLSCQNQTCWNSVLGGIVNAGYPILATEIGQFDCKHSYIDPVMAWLDSHQQQGYMGWTWGPFNCSQDPALITNNNGSPSQTFGQGYKDHLLSLP